MTFMASARRGASVWHARGREPGLSVLLVLETIAVFAIMPLDEMGLLGSRFTDVTMLLVILAAVSVVSRHRTAVVAIVVSAIVAGATGWWRGQAPNTLTIAVHFLAVLIYVATLMLVVGAAVFAPGRVNTHRIQGAVVLYLKLAVLFAYAAQLLEMLSPGAFATTGATSQIFDGARAIYFSLVTLTSTGYGDIVPVHPLARALATLESLIGQLFPATLLARLVTQEAAARTARPDRD